MSPNATNFALNEVFQLKNCHTVNPTGVSGCEHAAGLLPSLLIAADRLDTARTITLQGVMCVTRNTTRNREHHPSELMNLWVEMAERHIGLSHVSLLLHKLLIMVY